MVATMRLLGALDMLLNFEMHSSQKSVEKFMLVLDMENARLASDEGQSVTELRVDIVPHILMIVSATPCSTAVQRRSIHESRLTGEHVEAGMKSRQSGRKPPA
jgi:hypothetical protein